MYAKRTLGFFFLFILISTSAAFAQTIYETQPSNTTCISLTAAQQYWQYTNDTGEWNTAYKNYTCQNNCSTTLGNCRPLDDVQASMSIGIIVLIIGLCMLGFYVRKITPGLDMPIYILAAFTAILLSGGIDVLTPTYRTLVLAFSIMPFGFLFASLYYSTKMRRDDGLGYSSGHE